MITIEYRGELEELTKTRSEALDAERVDDIIRQIGQKYGKQAKKAAKCMLITVDGVSIHLLDGYKTKLEAVGKVSFLPISGGG